MRGYSYLRVSSAGQVEGDGFTRQRAAILTRADALQVTILAEFRDEGVSGTLGLADRPGLSELLEQISRNGVELVLVERADRIARDLIESELILREFRSLGVPVIEAESGHDLTEGSADNPSAKLIRQVLGAVAEFEKDSLVSKLRAARRRRGRCEGRKPYGFRPGEQEIVDAAHAHRARGATAVEIARLLNSAGLHTRTGRQWTRQNVERVLFNKLPSREATG